MHALLTFMPYIPFRTDLICVPYSIDMRPSPFYDHLQHLLAGRFGFHQPCRHPNYPPPLSGVWATFTYGSTG
jgi:hypothetical protein